MRVILLASERYQGWVIYCSTAIELETQNKTAGTPQNNQGHIMIVEHPAPIFRKGTRTKTITSVSDGVVSAPVLTM